MDLTPETLRSATFRDKLRGYHPDDVDEFLESVARGLEVLLARLRDASDKARAVSPPPVEAPLPQADEAVRTLALAQRTADLAISEAKAEADRLLKAADQKARRVVNEAQESAASTAEKAQAKLRADLERLQAARDQLRGEVQALGSWLEGERGRIRKALLDVADRVDNVREGGDAPSPKPVSIPAPPAQKSRGQAPVAAQAPGEAPAPPAPVASPPVEQPRAAKPPAVERPKAATAPSPATPTPSPRGQNPAKGQPTGRPQADRKEPTRRPTETGDAAVLKRAEVGLWGESDDEDPFFAELRAAMLDQSPLGPREDDDQGS
ncbi:MAG TPA: DivIVA domain-containing protein [Acidimicrobiales bacterium]|nr:DivIVA domain-containing protein [Acidimicrobiales bacterium]